MRKLADNPRPNGVEKMKGQKESYYRIPVREWRIIYTIEDDVLLVLVVQVGPRKDIYRDF
jgi:mRNA interferase RelE/StbE